MLKLSSIWKGILKAFCLALVAFPMAVSCDKYDDSELRDKIEDLVDMIYNLEQRLNSEIKTLQDMFEGGIRITELETSEDGTTTIKFSNKETITLFSKNDLKSFVTYINDNGVYYWAYIDEDGKKVCFLDQEGMSIPVSAEQPKVIVRDDETYLVIGGVEYPLSGNSVFSDYELVKDENSGEVYAVTFTFGEDMTFTVTVDGASGFFFMLPGLQKTVIDNYYVGIGRTADVLIETRGVVDYVLQIPDGWRIKESENSSMGEKYLSISAPSKAMLETGVAAADGELKVVAVLEGGKATVAKLYLSTTPFKEVSVTLEGATAKKYNGLQKFVYGLCKSSEYDEKSLLETAKTLLDKHEYPKGYGISDYDLNAISLAEILDEDLVPKTNYTFWVLPIFYDDSKDGNIYVEEGNFYNVTAKFTALEFEIRNIKFKDADLFLTIEGTDSYYAGMSLKGDFYVDDVVMHANNGVHKERTTLTYNASAFTFFEMTPQPATEYVAWLVLAEEGKTYTAADVMVKEFSTGDYTYSSEAVKVVADPITADVLEITAKLTAQGAENIYYAYLAPNEAKGKTTNEERFQYLLTKGKKGSAPVLEAKASECGVKMAPEKALVLFAAAVNSDGEYNDVIAVDCMTTSIPHNNLKVNISMALNSPKKIELNISTTGGEETGYLYWVGKTAESFWKSSTYLGGSAESAHVYMFLNSTNSRFANIAAKYPIVNGKITITDHTVDESYVIVAMAKDKDGVYSYATEFKFTPHIANIGNIVLSSDAKWEAARPTVAFKEELFDPNFGDYGFYVYDITLPAGYTAYILSGTDAYFEGDISLEDKILEIIKYADSRKDDTHVIDEAKDKEFGYPHGWAVTSYKHGSPGSGTFVVWASQEFHDSVCTYNDGEKCGGNYTEEVYRTDNNGNQVLLPWENKIHINDGKPITVSMPNGISDKTQVVNKVYVVCQDQNHNCYEPFVFDVPYEYFIK